MSNIDNKTINYKKILAVIGSDMRNSLTLMFQALSTHSQPMETLSINELNEIKYQVQRLNGDLTQLLSLYNVEDNKLMVNINEVIVSDIIEYAVLQNNFYTESKNINIDVNIDEDLTWYLDRNLIIHLIDDIISNAVRYSHKHISIDVKIIDNILNISISDDSDGYPEEMMVAAIADIESLASDYGRMGIGLLFSKLIVLSHSNDGKCGKFLLENNTKLGGSTFTVQLP